MALTELTYRRIGIVTQHCVNSIHSDSIRHVGIHGAERRKAEVTYARLCMLQSLVQVEDTNAVHFLDDPKKWAILQREMRIPSSDFYRYVDTDHTGWGQYYSFTDANTQIIGTPIEIVNPMTDRFYATKIIHQEDGTKLYRPVRPLGFPDFEAIGEDECRQIWGYHHDSELSTDKSLRLLKLEIDGTELVELPITGGDYNHVGQSAKTYRLKGETSDPLAKVKFDKPFTFDPADYAEKWLRGTVTADDDSTALVEVRIIRT